MGIEEALLKITTELTNDAEYRESWKANIAMSYKDCEHWYKQKTGKKQFNNEDRHIIANEAAEYFLKLLCDERMDNNKTLSICDKLQSPLGNIRRSYLVKFVDPSKLYDVEYLAPHQSTSGEIVYGFFKLKGEDLTENQILNLFLHEAL